MISHGRKLKLLSAALFWIAAAGVGCAFTANGGERGPNPLRPTVEEALEDLRSEDPSERVAAVRSLSSRGAGAAEAVDSLIPHLADTAELNLPDEEKTTTLSGEATYALASIGTAAEGPLRAALKHEDRDVRKGAAVSLGVLCSRGSAGDLLELTNDPDGFVRSDVMLVLGKLGGEHALRALIAALRDPQARVRLSAFVALSMAGEEAVPRLVETIRARGPHWMLALGALEQIGSPAAAPLLSSLLEDGESEVRRRALIGLANGGNRGALEKLFVLLEDQSRSLLRARVAEIAARAGGEGFEFIVKALGERPPGGRATAALALEAWDRSREEESVSALLAALKREQDDWVRRHIVAALGSYHTPAVAEALVERLREDDPMVRRETILVLGAFPGPPLDRIAALLQDENEQARRSAAAVLLKLKDPRTVPALVGALDDEGVEVRLTAARALGEIGDPRSFAALAKAVEDPDEQVRREAVKAMGRMGDRGVDHVIQALKTEDPALLSLVLRLFVEGEQPTGSRSETALKNLMWVLGTVPAPPDPFHEAFGRVGVAAVEPLLDTLNEGLSTWRQRRQSGRAGGSGDPPRTQGIAATSKAGEAARALGHLDDPRVVPALIEALTLGDPWFHRDVQAALKLQGAAAVEPAVARSGLKV